jgi:hypothetical protein
MNLMKKAKHLLPMAFRKKKCDHGRIRTLNPQSRNLIFYPVELRSHLTFGTANVIKIIHLKNVPSFSVCYF